MHLIDVLMKKIKGFQILSFSLYLFFFFLLLLSIYISIISYHIIYMDRNFHIYRNWQHVA
jgi:hypothetical protein